jgi:hypothetical protein
MAHDCSVLAEEFYWWLELRALQMVWQMATQMVDMEYGHYSCSGGFCLPNVAADANANLLNSAQEELLLLHWKLNISMQQVQELMRVVEAEEPGRWVSDKDRVICPRIRAAAKCPISLCQSCQMSRAKQRKPEVKKSKAVPEEAGALMQEHYETGDFVSLDQYVVKTPGWLPTGFGQESYTNMFHGGNIFRDVGSKYIWEREKQLIPNLLLESGCGKLQGLE